MNPKTSFARLFFALHAVALSVAPLWAQVEDPQTGIPVRIWARAYSGTDTIEDYMGDQRYLSTTYLGSNHFSGIANYGGTWYCVYDVPNYNYTYITADLQLAGTFLPWSLPSAPTVPSDGSSASYGMTATSPNQSMTVDLGIVRVVPGRTYTVNVTQTNVGSGVVNVVPPPGYRVVLNNIPRNSCPIANNVTLRLLPTFDLPSGLAGFGSSFSNCRADSRITVGFWVFVT